MKSIGTTFITLALVMGLAAHGRDRLDDWVAQTKLPPVLSEVAVEVRARDGAMLRAFPVEEGRMRLAVQLEQVDPDFVAQLIRYEDHRFYSHTGVDFVAMMRAAAQAAWHGQVVSGGSTLTMQVARLLENSGTGSVTGKLRQMRVAWALERRLSKEDILSLYLHHAPYGGAVEGIRAASWAWFEKEPYRLTEPEAALLIALPQAPEARRPDRHPVAAFAARERVMKRLDMGATDRQPDIPRKMRSIPQDAPHLAAMLRSKAPTALRHDTTIDANLQRQIQALALRAVAQQPKGVSTAILIADHTTGEILAHVGSPAYSAAGGALGFVDMTSAIRSPGSTLKPLIYGLAFDEGLVHPDTLINDAPVSFGTYAPQNFDGEFRGMLTVRDALGLSLNIPPVLLTHEMGVARLMAGLRRAGVDAKLPSGQAGLAVALGGAGMTLRDLVQLYAGIAQGGRAQTLHEQPLAAPPSPPRQIISDVAAWQVTDILADILPPRGTAAAAGQVAYKTGTSYGHRDAWAIGYDGRHVVGVWLGRPDGTPVPGAFGGDLAAPILFEALGRIGHTREALPLPPSDTIILGTASLPEPLRIFQPRDAVFAKERHSPVVTFPPDGATLRRSGYGVPLKLREGVLPLTVLVNGAPVLTQLRERNAVLSLDVAGFNEISVIDAKGRSASVEIRLD
ncbi:penicillin-binding protein 1C [Sulfitobacter donghicola]|uniref:peptidoglycan glycosyltransferase n=1 Tax=Sulfitobacter donghicola DSW-25 = KCTC 12864 = JCM 14565 TaxID=1300350 RepID=A0A073IL63_9RHOB|nr:penicillin-binding protein 1C [Sulfitobacter donghicola]KEJ90494.1 penicillin-binding protein 1C [Sulfitobacter donghicola DSW-25 = KCTC 12864 = JCM 14565]KIN67735.1 Penicillin-binding protein 1C [Sulfitobacter donghicola DSW-25 = KCTC 12864 = JCM 14565]